MAGTVVADQLEAASTSTLVLKNGVANTPPTIQDSAGTQIGTFCRAWASFAGGASSPITPQGHFNVASVTRTATGRFTITFTTNMPDANYAPIVVTGTEQYTAGAANTGRTVSSFTMESGYPNGTGGSVALNTQIYFAVFR
jgi:hypothetical protein